MALFPSDESIYQIQTRAPDDGGVGGQPVLAAGKQFLILSTQEGVLVKAAADELRQLDTVPFAAYCSDPCDGRTLGNGGAAGISDSLPLRNNAALGFRRVVRSLPDLSGVIGIATCDNDLPAMMMALAAMPNLPCVLVPGGVTLPPADGEDAGAAASQVVAEALGMALPHSALAPSGQPVWTELATRAARSVTELEARGITMRDILTPASIRNAMVVHAAFGGSTNLLLHIPAIAHAAGLARPTLADWIEVSRSVPRLVDVLPNGPKYHPSVRAFLAGGVPEVMLHLQSLGLLDTSVMTASGSTLAANLRSWEGSERRSRFQAILRTQDRVEPHDVIMSPERARARGLTGTVVFPVGNLAPEGSVIKSTAIDPSVVDADGVYRKQGPARVFTSEAAAIAALREGRIKAGDVMVLAGAGPLGTGMEEPYQLTSALKHLPLGKHVAVITDTRFAAVSTGACIGHIGPEALAGGPIGKLQDGDWIEIVIDRVNMTGTVNLIGAGYVRFTEQEALAVLASRPAHPQLAPHPALPDDTRLWAGLQQAGGGIWGGCVYDTESILARLQHGSSN